MGESQVIIVKDVTNGKVYYSAVVDCYTCDGLNKTSEILDAHGVRFLNLLCWTHPDDDHSQGLSDLVETYCNENTKILLPEGIYGQTEDLVEYNAEHIQFFNSILANNSNRRYNVHTATIVAGFTQGVDLIKFLETSREFYFRIETMAPCSAIIRRRQMQGLKRVNDISIALLVTLGELSFFLTGDIENQTIEHLADYRLSTLSYLKTPHHTSTYSDRLLRLFDDVFEGHKIPITCTTAYKRFNLPNLELVERYKLYTNTFYSTHDESSAEHYGVIEIVANPYDHTYTERLSGSARKLFDLTPNIGGAAD